MARGRIWLRDEPRKSWAEWFWNRHNRRLDAANEPEWITIPRMT